MGTVATLKRPYLAGLDGLRALAVIAVVIFHAFPGVLPGGFIGVDIFFVISGFLITSLLIHEHATTGRIKLKAFWKRRARRLLPALLTVVVLTSSVALFLNGDILVGIARQIFGAATFTNNWMEIAAGTNYFEGASLHLFTNFWSLAVEEQFYLVWPLIIIAVLAIRDAKLKYRVGMWGSLLFTLGSATWMGVALGDNATRVYYGTDTHAFGLMFGAALALWGHVRYAKAAARGAATPSARFRYPVIMQLVGMVALGGLVALMLLLSESASITYRGGLALASICTGLIIIASVSKRSWLQRSLEMQALKWIGVRSYGIYLWHWPLIALLHYALPISTPTWIGGSIAVSITVALSALSYHYLEVPIRKEGVRAFLRHRLTHGSWMEWKRMAYPSAVLSVALIAMTAAAAIVAPDETKAERQIKATQQALAEANKKADELPKKHGPAFRLPVRGSDITLIGDSVSLASVPQLEATLPGIYIDAEVSRSMRRGGLETIEKLIHAKKIRPVLVVALGTNGYYGDGFIERLMKEVGEGRYVVFVTSYAPVEWVKGNNAYLHSVASRYSNVRIADWSGVITKHRNEIGPDGIHPTTDTGKTLYATTIKSALKQIK